MATDPIETMLQDLGKMRGAAYNELLRLPAPSPLKGALEEVDGLLSRLETDIQRVQAATKAPLALFQIQSGVMYLGQRRG